MMMDQWKKKMCKQAVKKEVMAALMFHLADKFRYQNYSIGLNMHLKTTNQVENILNTYR